ncbi:glutathione peroxidase [Tenacibaculum sp. MAR_2009_124]|uniref:glutathione peroxidase n=1 Tax=Tenacibaculum sp. MAR_2009_124 TaxID=1250059 RepID=UPI00089B577C|nr:glutathione peroxidase [Tenacibaculum sp. MAR_2009_124]SEB44260.1 glutathione peroxidase [Tenacibaculum sp. MAR_2009_124]
MTLFGTSIKAQTLEPKTSLYDITISDINGKPIGLSEYKGKKILFVNVASKCGFTSQYKGLQELYEKYKDDLMIIGVPCNQFGSQEPGTASEIESFCEVNYGVTFLITEKVEVKGENKHDLYKWLTQRSLNGKSNSTVKWNFQKYLIDEDGRLLDYFYSMTKPNSKKISKYI